LKDGRKQETNILKTMMLQITGLQFHSRQWHSVERVAFEKREVQFKPFVNLGLYWAYSAQT
jgi:hypothetical protein